MATQSLVEAALYLPAQKCRIQKKILAQISVAERTSTRLLYLTQTGEHKVFIRGRDIPLLRFLTKRGRKTPFSAFTG